MLALPGFLQLPLTFLTGKPHSGQRPVRIAPTAHLAGPLLSALLGLWLGVAALRGSGWLLLALLPSWALVLHGMRNLRMMVFHQCAHRIMWRRWPVLEVIAGDITAGILMVQSFRNYSYSHRREHHGIHHMSLRDPTVYDFLIGLRLGPGMSRRAMWTRILVAIFSPLFHIRFFVSRLHSGLRRGSTLQRLVTVAVPAIVAWEWADHAVLTAYLVLWLLPLTVFFQMSTVLRLCVKHTFPAPGSGGRSRAALAALTSGVFLGEMFPAREASSVRTLATRSAWLLRLLVIHFPSRYLVLTGDAVCHDFHHRRPMSRDWPNYLFARQADQDAGHAGWPPYEEVWGLIPAINHVLDSLRDADPGIYDARKLPALPAGELYNSFDD
jgi:Fatty acid desaturase